MTTGSRGHHVAVYSIDLFRGSEFFIQQQAAEHSWAVTFVGEAIAGTPPPDVRYLVGSHRDETLHQLAEHPPSLVHAHFGVGIPHAARLARHLGVPLVVTLHGFDATRHRGSCVMSGRPNLVRYGLRRPHHLRSVDRCLTVSEFIREQALRAGAEPSRTQVHHLGTSLHGLPRRPGVHRDPADAFRIAHVARLVEKKGTSVLLHALASARRDLGRFSLRIVGDGPLRKSLEHTVQRLGLDDSVRFLGAQPHSEALSVIADADALCLPSVVARNGDAEGFGMVMLEAAAMGTAVVATDSGGIPDFVQPEETGLLVPPDDAPALGRALVRLRSSAELSRRVVLGAARRVATDFDVRRQTARLEEIFEDVVASATARP